MTPISSIIESFDLLLLEDTSLHQLAFSDANWEKHQLTIATKLIELFIDSHDRFTPIQALSPHSLLIKNEKECTLSISTKAIPIDSQYCPLESSTDTPHDPYRDDLFILGLLLYFIFTKQSLLFEISRLRRTGVPLQESIAIQLDHCSLRYSTIKLLKGLLQIDPAKRISLIEAQALLLAPLTPTRSPAASMDSPRFFSH